MNIPIAELKEAKAGMDEGSIASEDTLRDLMMEHADALIAAAERAQRPRPVTGSDDE